MKPLSTQKDCGLWSRMVNPKTKIAFVCLYVCFAYISFYDKDIKTLAVFIRFFNHKNDEENSVLDI